MNARMIKHDDAVKDLMAERYLLGELNAAEREAYEEHLFSCDACFEQVKVGTEFVSHLRHIGTQDPQDLTCSRLHVPPYRECAPAPYDHGIWFYVICFWHRNPPEFGNRSSEGTSP